MPGSRGQLFAIYHPPNPLSSCQGNIVVLSPFAEEMNRSRRMMSLQAVSLSEAGFGVLIFDFFGTGDSAGEFGEAGWETWRNDLSIAIAWLKAQSPASISLLALRMSSLLAFEYVAQGHQHLEKIVLWQPVLNGANMITQFLRLRLASSMLDSSREKESTKELRAMLSDGKSLEVAGYELNPDLVSKIDLLKIQNLMSGSSEIIWFELVSGSNRSLSPASRRVIDNLGPDCASINTQVVVGEPFWSLQEVTVVPELIDRTTRAFQGRL